MFFCFLFLCVFFASPFSFSVFIFSFSFLSHCMRSLLRVQRFWAGNKCKPAISGVPRLTKSPGAVPFDTRKFYLHKRELVQAPLSKGSSDLVGFTQCLRTSMFLGEGVLHSNTFTNATMKPYVMFSHVDTLLDLCLTSGKFTVSLPTQCFKLPLHIVSGNP